MNGGESKVHYPRLNLDGKILYIQLLNFHSESSVACAISVRSHEESPEN